MIASRLSGLESGEDLKHLVARLKEETGGVPISYKFAASHYLEEEIELAVAAGVDVIVIDGAEAGTHAGQPSWPTPSVYPPCTLSSGPSIIWRKRACATSFDHRQWWAPLP